MNRRIVVTTGIFPPDIGGPATFVPELTKALTNDANSVQVVTLGDNNTNFSYYNIPVKKISRNINRILRIFIVVPAILIELFDSDSIFAAGLYEEAAIANLILKRKSIAKIVGDPIWERFRNDTGSNITIDEFNLSKLRGKYYFERKFHET